MRVRVRVSAVGRKKKELASAIEKSFEQVWVWVRVGLKVKLRFRFRVRVPARVRVRV